MRGAVIGTSRMDESSKNFDRHNCISPMGPLITSYFRDHLGLHIRVSMSYQVVLNKPPTVS
jgi:hypothetical protein